MVDALKFILSFFARVRLGERERERERENEKEKGRGWAGHTHVYVYGNGFCARIGCQKAGRQKIQCLF